MGRVPLTPDPAHRRVPRAPPLGARQPRPAGPPGPAGRALLSATRFGLKLVMMVKKPHTERGIEPPQREALRQMLAELARERFRDQVVDTLEIDHLVDIATNYSLLLSDIYQPEKIEQILSRADPAARWLARLNLADDKPRPDAILRLRQVPDQIKTVADKCLYDVGVFHRDSYRGVSLTNLGVASYRMASEILEILAEDRRLRDYFRSNTLGNMPIEDEIIFLKQCAHRFTIHADLLKELRIMGREGELAPSEPAGHAAGAAPPAAPAGAAAPATPAAGPAAASPLHPFGPPRSADPLAAGGLLALPPGGAAPDAGPAGDSGGPTPPEASAPVAAAKADSSALARRGRFSLERRRGGEKSATGGSIPGGRRALEAAQEAPSAPQMEKLCALERMLVFSALSIEALRTRLRAIVIDQNEAVETLCDEFSLYATGTQNPRRPSSYLFVGPTGVGKNYLIETLAQLLEEHWGEGVPFLLLEGPNFTYPSDINELRGATRGFIRSDEEGVLTEFHHRSSRAPFAVILVDEVEKSHAQLQRFFLSVMDRGTVTDNRGQTLRFSNTMLVFTSNLGYSRLQQQNTPIGYERAKGPRRYPRREVDREIKKALSPEFLNRLLPVHFAPLSRQSIARIFDLELEKVASLYERIHGLRLEVTARAKEALIELGYSDEYGARFLAQTLQRHCNVEVSKKLKREEEGGSRNVRPILDYLRQVRAGQRLYREREAERLVHDQTRVRVAYRRLRIDHRDGEFVYEAGRPAK